MGLGLCPVKSLLLSTKSDRCTCIVHSYFLPSPPSPSLPLPLPLPPSLQSMLLVQGFIYIGMTGVVFINLKEALRPTTKSRTIRPEPVPAREPCVCLRVFACMQEEGLGVVARVEQVSIYIVFFAINLISGARPKTGGGESEMEGRGRSGCGSRSASPT